MSGFSRRQFFIGAAAPMVAAQRAAEPRPNILLIVADDLAAWMCGCYGSTEMRTPNIDLIARLGARFQYACATTPAGSPSRATLFTGRTPMQHGIEDVLTGAPPASFAGEVMISELLANQGYDCGYVGRWAMGGDQKPGRGYGFTYTMADPEGPYQDPRMSRNGEVVAEKGYLTELATQAALGFLDKQTPDKPFFLALGYPNPAQPYDGHPQKYYDLYANTTFETVGWELPAPNASLNQALLADSVGNLRKCAAGLSALDAQIPLLLSKLRARELWTNTLIVFTSDHGNLLGRHGLWGPGRASEPVNMYEEVVQVPLLVSWPGEVPVESTRPEIVGLYDVFPTLCQAAGLELPAGRNLCGHSFLNRIRGPRVPAGEPDWPTVVYSRYANTLMIRDRRFKLVDRNGGKGPNELYHLEKDPRERRNQYDNDSYLTVRDRLRAYGEEWIESYSG